jgi:dihydrofolate reductase
VRVVYYAATSLDGYIADVVMGSHTYEFALAHPPWPHPDKPTWVFTSRALPSAHPSVHLTSEGPEVVMAEIERAGAERVWLMGGGALAASFRAVGLITDYELAIVPVLLGSGLPLFGAGGHMRSLTLEKARTYASGLVMLTYRASSDEPI